MSAQVDELVDETVDRASTIMRAVVKIRDENGKVWKETAEVISVSQTGAGFYVMRECKPGRLVWLKAPIEPHLRFYDHEKALYRVWGVVQHCHRLTDVSIGFQVGIAFVGRDAPESYWADPIQSYRISGMNEDGLWKIKEAQKEFRPRKDPRFYAAIDHYLAVIDAKNSEKKGERATTVNISKNGAAVLTTMDLHVGDRVKFISEQFDFSGLAVVCSRKDTKGGKARLSIQFVGVTFPIDRISAKDVGNQETVYA
jgi:hypothetical protein